MVEMTSFLVPKSPNETLVEIQTPISSLHNFNDNDEFKNNFIFIKWPITV